MRGLTTLSKILFHLIFKVKQPPYTTSTAGSIVSEKVSHDEPNVMGLQVVQILMGRGKIQHVECHKAHPQKVDFLPMSLGPSWTYFCREPSLDV